MILKGLSYSFHPCPCRLLSRPCVMSALIDAQCQARRPQAFLSVTQPASSYRTDAFEHGIPHSHRTAVPGSPRR